LFWIDFPFLLTIWSFFVYYFVHIKNRAFGTLPGGPSAQKLERGASKRDSLIAFEGKEVAKVISVVHIPASVNAPRTFLCRHFHRPTLTAWNRFHSPSCRNKTDQPKRTK
jgi:hypothetical protein